MARKLIEKLAKKYAEVVVELWLKQQMKRFEVAAKNLNEKEVA